MSSQVSADEVQPPTLSVSDLVGLSATVLLIAILVISALFLNRGASFLAWQLPNVIFAAFASATFALLRRKRPVTFEHACGVTAIGIIVTSIVVVAQIGWTFDLPNLEMVAPYVLVHYATYVLPVVILFLLGAAQNSRQQFVISLLVGAVLLALVVRISGPYAQFVQSLFYSMNLVFGFPLAVLGRQYSS